MKRYKLLRDLPTFKAGDTFRLTGAGDLVLENPQPPHGPIVYAYNHTTLQKFPNILEDWFEELPEPLIKDEAIRKAVRAWAEAVGREKLLAIKIGGRLELSDGSPHLVYISFHADEETLKSLEDRTYYTLEELCGEEE